MRRTLRRTQGHKNSNRAAKHARFLGGDSNVVMLVIAAIALLLWLLEGEAHAQQIEGATNNPLVQRQVHQQTVG